MDLEKKDTLTTEGSGGSQDDPSPTSSDNNPDSFFAKAAETPKKVATVFERIGLFTPRQGKLKDEFGIPGRPSPPKNSDGAIVEMEIADAEIRINNLGFFVATLSADWYGKLLWIIGKGLDKVILQRKGFFSGRATVLKMLNSSTAVGQRFNTIYKYDGDDKFESENLINPLQFMKDSLGVEAPNENAYTIYSDPDHGNMEYFCREQTCGNCHMQGPLLLHWILSLWHDPDKRANDVRMIHMSKYLRNAVPNDQLYSYIVEEDGDFSLKTAVRIMPEAFGISTNCGGVMSFDEVVERLKTRGPALVEMANLSEDFQEKGTVVYAGSPPTESKKLDSGHGMLLIGVFKDTNVHPAVSNPAAEYVFKSEDNLGTDQTQVHLLLQNWWPGKPFLKVRYDYFLHCGGTLIFSNGNKVNEVTSDSYSEKTNGVRRAVTAAAMEKGNMRRGVKLEVEE